MSKRFDELKSKYEKNFCTIDQLRRYVALSVITAEEFEEITGLAYSEEVTR